MENQKDERIDLIAIMGATGAGKSSFINHVIQKGTEEAEVGHGQESCTSDVTPMPFQLDHFKGSIIDTPGFDDTHLSDTQILEKIANWMEATYRIGIKITGILYLRDITQARMSGTSLKNLSMFRKLCGSESLKNVVIVTTKWDAVPIETGELREQDLMNKFLQPMLTLGAQQARHNNTLVSAQDVLRKVLGNRGLALKLQNELVDEKKTLGETEAGAAVGDDIDKLRAKYENEKEELMKLIKEENNETIRVLLQQEQQKLTAIQAKAEKDKQTLEASREEQMAAYEKRLEAIAKKTGESSGTVLMKSLTEGATAFGPIILQQLQEWREERSKEKEIERAHQVQMGKDQEDREAAREHRLMEELKQRDVQAKQEAKDQQIRARQDELERSLRQAQDETARLRTENSQRRSECQLM